MKGEFYMVLEFITNKEYILQQKLDRFNKLKVKLFMDCLDASEENEMNNIQKWLKIHNN